MSLKSRNVDLKSISKYWFSMNATVSILHRISGIMLLLLIPFVLWLLDHSLSSEVDFLSLKVFFGSIWVKFFIWLFLSALFYHMLAGIKHLFMDVGYLETIKGSYWSSLIVFCLSLIVIVALGVKILW
ncbi:MAG: succinate dehydrogenase [Gammaproteobacteria bacterium]|jgi:succinate dehydrogenase / fumarate reductase cytochrome b subunit|nr:succinate dehydrogenase [Gammaproteobacteria bacterium]